MPGPHNLAELRAELKEILDVCVQRASLPVTLPHCAICARYSADNLAFEALMALLDFMPAEMLPEAIAAASDRLMMSSAAVLKQHVDYTTLPVLMDSPGWPLVRSLVIDLANQDICKHFNDPRLNEIEEITLLGFAYGGCEVESAFNDAFFHTTSFANLRSVEFHSTEDDAEMSRRFWSSPLAKRLEKIEGIGYQGETFSEPLRVRELILSSHRGSNGFTLQPLLDPKITPQLSTSRLAHSPRTSPHFCRVLPPSAHHSNESTTSACAFPISPVNSHRSWRTRFFRKQLKRYRGTRPSLIFVTSAFAADATYTRCITRRARRSICVSAIM